MMMKKIPWLGWIAILFMVSGCEAALGDKCTTSNDCPTGMVCDTDSPGGYCLVAGCEGDEECPEKSVCVSFTDSQAYCLKKCKKNKDCRGGSYSCRDDIGEKKFCYVTPEYPYGRDESNELSFDPPEDDEETEETDE